VLLALCVAAVPRFMSPQPVPHPKYVSVYSATLQAAFGLRAAASTISGRIPSIGVCKHRPAATKGENRFQNSNIFARSIVSEETLCQSRD
jgi:hypothetical protein